LTWATAKEKEAGAEGTKTLTVLEMSDKNAWRYVDV
jgi:hypothetical protein